MKKDVLVFEKKKQAVCSSRDVAKRFNKRHQHILESIDKIIVENSTVKNWFALNSYIADNGQSYREFSITRDGFSILAMGFTGKKALEWKVKYINAFNTMEKHLSEKSTIEWQETRKQGIVQRNMLTDALQVLEGVYIADGSKNGKTLYSNFTKMVNKEMRIDTRDNANVSQLAQIAFLEDYCAKLVMYHISQGTDRKEIYYICKAQVQAMVGMTRTALAIGS